MRHLMTATLALALLGGTSALAQPPGGQSSGPHGGGAGAHGGQGGSHGGQGGQGGQGGSHGGQGGQGGSHGGSGGTPGGFSGTHGGPGGPNANTGHPSGGYGGGNQGGTHGGPGGPNANTGHPSGGYGGGNQGGTHGGPGGPGANTGHPSGAYGGGFQGGTHGGPGGGGAGGGGGHPTGIHNAPSTYHPGFGAPGFRPGPGAARPNYSPQFFPRVWQPSHQYAWRGGWSPQPGYYYRHWGYGDRLPFGWFGPRWFIDDYYLYDLPVPPYGYEWIRVGPDALLINLRDGVVVESVYGLFY